jgi:hypothetical protein
MMSIVGNGASMISILKLEAGAALAASLLGYSLMGGHWLLFAVLFLLPDLTMLGYLRNPAAGAMIYNAGHSYIAPGALAAVGLVGGLPIVEPLAIIWIAHIAFDRVLGFGLKYPDRFGHTHLSGHG